jgi:hypothetical protein
VQCERLTDNGARYFHDLRPAHEFSIPRDQAPKPRLKKLDVLSPAGRLTASRPTRNIIQIIESDMYHQRRTTDVLAQLHEPKRSSIAYGPPVV